MAYQSWSVVFGEQPSASKWGILGTNDASFNDGTGIGAGAILPNNLIASASTLNTWAWDSWTPIWTNITVGNGTVVAKYIQIGKFVRCKLKFTMGSTSSISSNNAFSLPVTATSPVGIAIGNCYLEDLGVFGYEGSIRLASTTTATIIIWNAGGSYVTSTGIGSTAPFTWATGDFFGCSFAYEAA